MLVAASKGTEAIGKTCKITQVKMGTNLRTKWTILVLTKKKTGSLFKEIINNQIISKTKETITTDCKLTILMATTIKQTTIKATTWTKINIQPKTIPTTAMLMAISLPISTIIISKQPATQHTITITAICLSVNYANFTWQIPVIEAQIAHFHITRMNFPASICMALASVKKTKTADLNMTWWALLKK